MEAEAPTSSRSSGKSTVDVSDKRINRSVSARIVAAFTLVCVTSAIVGLVASGASYQAPPLGIPDAGPVVSWGLTILTATVFVTAMCTIGWLLFAAFLDPAARDVVSHTGRVWTVRAGIAAAIWSVTALTAAAFTFANVLGISLSEAVRAQTIATYAWEVTSVRTLAISSVLALIVAVGCFFTIKLTTATLWLCLSLVAICTPALAGHAAGLGNHSVAIVNGVAHALAASVWVGGVIALGTAAWPSKARLTSPQLGIAARRFSNIALWCVVVLLGSGIANAFTRLASPDDLIWSGYGRLVVAKSVLLIALVGVGVIMRRRILATLDNHNARRSFSRIALFEILLMAVASGLGVALSATEPTRGTVLYATQGELLLGYPFPPAPHMAAVIGGWHYDSLFLTLSLLAAALYVAGVMRLRARGDKWSIWQTLSFLLGIGIVIWATNAGIATYAEMSVSLHMVQHMTLTMMAPIPLVLGAPVTLALRAIKASPTHGRGPRELILGTVHSNIARFFTHPATVLAIYAIGLYGLYFTSLFGALMSNHVGHIFMIFHFLATGLLISWVAIGIDPQPRKLPHWAKLIMVLCAIVIHTFFALALMSTSAIGASWYSVVKPPWMTDSVADTMLAGQVAWAVGELPTVILMLIIAVQWARSDERESKRRDRITEQRGDVELDQYNEYLAKLNSRDTRDPR